MPPLACDGAAIDREGAERIWRMTEFVQKDNKSCLKLFLKSIKSTGNGIGSKDQIGMVLHVVRQ